MKVAERLKERTTKRFRESIVAGEFFVLETQSKRITMIEKYWRVYHKIESQRPIFWMFQETSVWANFPRFFELFIL